MKPLNRLFWCVCGVVVLTVCACTEAVADKAPFRVLYSNDTTNIETCVSPFRRGGEPFRQEMLEATVDETAGTGVEVHLLQPGLGWVPWWNSKAYPFKEHMRFITERSGKKPSENGYAQYMADGGDMVAAFVARCRAKGLVPFISLRLNDSHGHDFVGMPPDQIPASWAWSVLTPTHVDHPEWRISQNLNDWGGRVLNWANPEVPKLKFQFIEEICEQYDIDGFELDFLRHCRFFASDETTSEQRLKVMTDFVRQTRQVLDRTEKEGRRRWLCVRIPCNIEAHDPLGIDVRAFAEAGVDMFNLSPYFFTEQQTDAAAIKTLLPDSSVYLEMTHTTSVGRSLTKGAYDNFTYRRTTDLQFYTAGHLAYARGLDGMSAFNFVYYREHGEKGRGPFNEPPFHVFEHLGDPAWLAKQPQHYILGVLWNDPPLSSRPLPKTLTAGMSATFNLDMAPPAGGWKSDGRMRIQTEALIEDSAWMASFNGEPLEETTDRSEPYENPYSPLLGSAEQHRAWAVPVALVKDGVNTVEVRMQQGEGKVKLVFFDLAIE